MSHSNMLLVRKQAPLTTRSSDLRCVSAAEHYTSEQYPKTDRTKPWKHLPINDLSWNTHQDFLKIPSLWEASLETQQRYFSKIILESNVTLNWTMSSDLFSTVLPIFDVGQWVCILHGLKTVIVFVFLTFIFHSTKVTPLANTAEVMDQGLYYCNSNIWLSYNSHHSEVISITDQLIFQNGKDFQSLQEGHQRAQNTALQHPWHNIKQFTPTTIHHNVLWLVWQKLCQYIQQRTPNTHSAPLIDNAQMVDPIKDCTEIVRDELSPDA